MITMWRLPRIFRGSLHCSRCRSGNPEIFDRMEPMEIPGYTKYSEQHRREHRSSKQTEIGFCVSEGKPVIQPQQPSASRSPAQRKQEFSEKSIDAPGENRHVLSWKRRQDKSQSHPEILPHSWRKERHNHLMAENCAHMDI